MAADARGASAPAHNQPQAGGGGPSRHDGEMVGLERPEQLGEVPHDYRGLLLIEDMYAVGRALQR